MIIIYLTTIYNRIGIEFLNKKGDKLMITSGNGLIAGDKGVIEKINPKRIKVKFDCKPNVIFTCLSQLIEPV